MYIGNKHSLVMLLKGKDGEGIPDGGEVGQVIVKTENGVGWATFGGGMGYDVLISMINFRLNIDNYTAEEGMTWAEWCNSSYNKDGYYISNDNVFCLKLSKTYKITGVNSTDIITDGNTYFIELYSAGTEY